MREAAMAGGGIGKDERRYEFRVFGA